MKYEIINLKDKYKVQGGTLTCYIPDCPADGIDTSFWRQPAIVIVPGGNYEIASEREAEPIALKFLSLGYNCFVLRYLNAPQGVHYPEQLLELACSVDFINKNADKLSTTKHEIFVVGFSAGGHLAASLSTDYTLAQKEYGEKLDCKVQGAGLIYPVINDKYGYKGTHDKLFLNVSEDIKKSVNYMRLDEMVSNNSAPAYIATTKEDNVVPYVNSLKYSEALSSFGINNKLHIFEKGMHGCSTFDRYLNPTAEGLDISEGKVWPYECAEFFRQYVKEIF